VLDRQLIPAPVVGILAPLPMLGIGPQRGPQRVERVALAHLRPDLRQAERLVRVPAVEPIDQPQPLAIAHDQHRRQAVPVNE
jgi:hypothetical protein